MTPWHEAKMGDASLLPSIVPGAGVTSEPRRPTANQIPGFSDPSTDPDPGMVAPWPGKELNHTGLQLVAAASCRTKVQTARPLASLFLQAAIFILLQASGNTSAKMQKFSLLVVT